jgi:G:T/U-mismatch repair DNA glycosylase
MEAGIFSLVGVALGGILAHVMGTLTRHSASRDADRQKAEDLLTQLARAVGTIRAAKAAFRERSASRRPRLREVGVAILQTGAGWADGNVLRGMATGAARMVAWDAAEGARFSDRLHPAAADANAALMQLSLMSPGLQVAAENVRDALDATVLEWKQADLAAAHEQLNDAMKNLRAAVVEFKSREGRQLGVHGRLSAPKS